MSDEDDMRRQDDPHMPEPYQYILQLMKRQEERSAALAEHSAAFEAETQRKFDFLVNQQAQLTATVGSIAEKLDRTTASIGDLLAAAVLQAEEIKSIGKTVDALAASVKAVDERGRNKDERLDALINIVERHISKGKHREG